MENKYKYIRTVLTIDDVLIRRNNYAEDAFNNTGYHIPAIDITKVELASIDMIDALRKQIEEYERRYKEDFDFCCICDMAIAYLKILEDEKNGKDS